MEGSNKVMQVVLVILLLMKSVMPSLEPQDMPNEEVEKDLCCIHLSLGFPVSSKFFFWLLSQLI
ncbi:unnamed protein product [Brassica oleracea]